MYHFHRLAVLPLILLLLAACATPGAAPAAQEAAAGADAATTPLRIVTTVSPITNIVYNIAGNKAAIVGIVPEGVNSHTFEPAPSDARRLAEADVIFVNGLKLEEPTLKLAEANLKEGAAIVLLGDQTITKTSTPTTSPSPKRAAARIRTCGPIPSTRCATPRSCATRWRRATRPTPPTTAPTTTPSPRASLRWTRRSRRRWPASRNRTASCSPITTPGPTLRPRYGMTVIGAIQPADFAEPSAQDIAEIIRQLKCGASPGDLRLRGLPVADPGADRPRDRRPVCGRPARRRPARRTRARQALLFRADERKSARDGGGAGRRPVAHRRLRPVQHPRRRRDRRAESVKALHRGRGGCTERTERKQRWHRSKRSVFSLRALCPLRVLCVVRNDHGTGCRSKECHVWLQRRAGAGRCVAAPAPRPVRRAGGAERRGQNQPAQADPGRAAARARASAQRERRSLDGRPAGQVAYVPQIETVDWNFPVTVEQVVLMGRVRKSSLGPWASGRIGG
jgi:hypothetical protein